MSVDLKHPLRGAITWLRKRDFSGLWRAGRQLAAFVRADIGRTHWPRLCAVTVVALALCWFAPWQFSRLLTGDRLAIGGIYSLTRGEFVLWEAGPDSVRYHDEQGRDITLAESRLAAPLFYARDAHKWGAFPITVAGREIYYDEAARTTRSVAMRPRAWNPAPVPLYFLLESRPEVADLEMPADAFRVTGEGLEFFRCDSGEVDPEKTRMFNKALNDAGVRFPLRAVASNATNRKPFDMGALLVDAGGRLFQLRMARSRPQVHDTGLTVDGTVRALVVDEHTAADFYGVLATEDALFLVCHNDTLVVPDLGEFNPDRQSLRLVFDAANMHVTAQTYPVPSYGPITLMALERDGSLVSRKEFRLPEPIVERKVLLERVTSLFFPLVVRQYVPWERGAGIFVDGVPSADRLLLSLLGAAVWCAVLYRVRGKKGRAGVFEYALCVVTGLPGLVSVLVLGPVRRAAPAGECVR